MNDNYEYKVHFMVSGMKGGITYTVMAENGESAEIKAWQLMREQYPDLYEDDNIYIMVMDVD